MFVMFAYVKISEYEEKIESKELSEFIEGDVLEYEHALTIPIDVFEVILEKLEKVDCELSNEMRKVLTSGEIIIREHHVDSIVEKLRATLEHLGGVSLIKAKDLIRVLEGLKKRRDTILLGRISF